MNSQKLTNNLTKENKKIFFLSKMFWKYISKPIELADVINN